MEDNSDVNREADVSSTTADVPENEEVVGSKGNVEMVIVVEKVEVESGNEDTERSIEEEMESQVHTATKELIRNDKIPVKVKECAQKMSSPVKITVSPIKVVCSPKMVISTSKNEETKQPRTSVAKANGLENSDNIVDSSHKTVIPSRENSRDSDNNKSSHSLEHATSSEVEVQELTLQQTPDKSVPNSISKSPLVKAVPETTQKEPTVEFVPETTQCGTQAISVSEVIPNQPPIKTVPETTQLSVSAKQLENVTAQKTEVSCKTPVDNHCDKSNDSQLETGSDINEKEHNRSISRELKSLIKSAKESKIISECTQLTSKTRKSRTCLDTSNSSLNSSVEAEKINNVRRNSNMSQKSNCSEKSEKATKRSMRSQNPEFVNKVKLFLNSVTGKCPKESDDEQEQESKKDNQNEISPRKKKMGEVQLVQSVGEKMLRVDPYCWRCNWIVEQVSNEKGHPPLQCTVCPRSYHYKCLSSTERSKIDVDRSWVCPECLGILHAESSDTRSVSMKKISVGLLCELLHHALTRMMDLNGVEPFMQPVDRAAFPDYDKYVVHPMDLSLMKESITNGLYGSTEAFMADAQWILHNSIIFNTLQAKLTAGARALVRLCRAEMGEIEACPECYAAAHARKPTWFTDVCSTPHVLLWAKLKGFPYWPAKGMSINNAGLVDVRFFGAHDRAWVPAKDCFLYSEKDPNNFRTKRQDILDSMQEAEQHIRNISRKYGKFVYPAFKTLFEPNKLTDQLKMMIPSFDGEIKIYCKEKSSTSSPKTKEKPRSNSKSSKSSVIDGETSENEEVQVVSRKMADGAEILVDEDFRLHIDSDKSMELDDDNVKNNTSRKRRRSELEEAVLTIIESSSAERQEQVETEPITRKRSKVNGATNGKPNDKVIQESTSKEDERDKATTIEDKIENNSNGTVQDSEVLPTSTTEKPEKLSSVPSTPIANSTPKRNSFKDKAEKLTPKQKPLKVQKSQSSDKDKQEDKPKRVKITRNRSLNNSTPGKVKHGGKSMESNTSKPINTDANRVRTNETKSIQRNKNIVTPNRPKSTKDCLQFDDDISLAVIARDVSKSSNETGMPTITSVRSLSVNHKHSTTNNSKTIEVTVEPNSMASIFIPTSTDNVRNMKEAVDKLQKLREHSHPGPAVGRVGVKAFARMTSPEPPPKQANMEVEVKTEPLDIEDADRHNEKMDLMEACNLRPVNAASNKLRDVRINKVVVSAVSRKTVSKPPEVRVKAKKTFPQPRKPDEGRSELNCKNSMVYIPIQPAAAQAPVRPTRTQAAVTSAASSTINTITSPLVPLAISSNVNVANKTSTTTVFANGNSSNLGQLSTIQSLGTIPAISQVPSTVHTVPLITSLNGQWTFSLQPMMSVGGVDNTSNSPIVNGMADRSNAGALVAVPTPANVGSILPQITSPPANNRMEDAAEMPRLQQRLLLNPFDSSTPVGMVPPPSTAGPLTAKLNQNALKLTDLFRTLLSESLEKVNEPAAHITSLKMQLEQLRWRHKQEIDELKHNYDLSLAEMRACFDKERAAAARAAAEARRVARAELDEAVRAAKGNQWCAQCGAEAQFYCCWNTAYCDSGCQRAHWPRHAALCAQTRSQDGSGNNSNSKDILARLQPAPHLAMRTGAPPAAAPGAETPRHSSLIVSVIEDGSGNQTVKCVGTYKAPSAQNISPVIINKQIMNNEDASAKKVTTSGGYLIVGGTAPQAQRRAHIQYVHT